MGGLGVIDILQGQLFYIPRELLIVRVSISSYTQIYRGATLQKIHNLLLNRLYQIYFIINNYLKQ